MNYTKKLKVLGVVLVLALVAGIVFWNGYKEARATRGAAVVCNTLGGIAAASATTSVTYLLANASASTTLVCFTDSISSLDINMNMTSSTTAQVLTWEYAFSDNGVDYFGENISTSGSISVSESSTTPTHTWAPQVTTLVSKNIQLGDINSKYFRIKIGTTVTNAGLWAQILQKTESN